MRPRQALMRSILARSMSVGRKCLDMPVPRYSLALKSQQNQLRGLAVSIVSALSTNVGAILPQRQHYGFGAVSAEGLPPDSRAHALLDLPLLQRIAEKYASITA